MKVRTELLVTCAALVFCAVTPVRAADLVTKSPAVEVPAWWYEGYAEFGWRFDMNNPDKSQLGKFYRYEDLRPGPFGNFYYGAHRTGPDPFDFDIWGTNVGWDDEAFGLDASRPGTYYFTFGWDQTPHVYSKGARTTFGPIGSSVLTTPSYPFPPSAASNAFVNANATMFDLGFRRDTASVNGRWTPTDNWDVTADYSHMHREGTQPGSAVTFTTTAGATTRATMQLPKPVDDTTQNANVRTEYAGSSFWGKPFNVAVGYGFSRYDDSLDSLTFQNPWASVNAGNFPLFNRYSLWPDNEAHNLNVTTGVGLPLMSRYMGTFQYTWMKQDNGFLPSTINPAVTPAILPGSDLDAHTLLSNNVLTTDITSNLSSKLRYRYYDYHSGQSPITIAGLFERPDTNTSPINATAFPVNFTKQNGDAELVYRPWKWLDVGGAYEWEQSRHEYANALDVVTLQAGDLTATTNENAVKGFADAKLWGWSTLRTSIRYSERRLQDDYINNVLLPELPATPASAVNNNAFRAVDLQNRNSTVIKSNWDINVTDTVTVTPNGGYQLDDYPADGVTTIGITKHEGWTAGVDLSWVVNPLAILYVSYMHDDGTRQLFQRVVPSDLFLNTNDLDDVFVVGGKFTLIPQTLFLDTTYTYSRGTSKWASDCGPAGCFSLLTTPVGPMPVYPDTHNTNHRIDAQAKYMLDPTWVRNVGFLPTAQPYVKFRVIYERNSNDSWQNQEQLLGWAVNPLDSTTTRAVFLGMPNPNYDVVVGMASIGVKW